MVPCGLVDTLLLTDMAHNKTLGHTQTNFAATPSWGVCQLYRSGITTSGCMFCEDRLHWLQTTSQCPVVTRRYVEFLMKCCMSSLLQSILTVGRPEKCVDCECYLQERHQDSGTAPRHQCHLGQPLAGCLAP